MNEQELRKKVVSIAKSYYGCKESDGSHKKIIDGYNSVSPIPSGYKMTYKDPWCATYVSFIGIKAGLSDIIPRECSCNRMIKLYKNVGRWIENDAYAPQIGDVIFYDWDDSGKGDNTGESDHVGIVAEVNGTTLKIIEGNINNSVGYRTMKVNGKDIRGYGIPNYASKASNVKDEDANSATSSLEYKIGDIVSFTGNKHYSSANSMTQKSCKAGTAKITSVSKNAKHPYHLVAEKGKGSDVYGWVDKNDISKKISGSSGNSTGTNASVISNSKVDSAKSFSKSLSGTYKTTTVLNMRAGASTSKPILTVIPRNNIVTCYGYYTSTDDVKWYYVTYTDLKGVRFTGYVSSKYLRK